MMEVIPDETSVTSHVAGESPSEPTIGELIVTFLPQMEGRYPEDADRALLETVALINDILEKRDHRDILIEESTN